MEFKNAFNSKNGDSGTGTCKIESPRVLVEKIELLAEKKKRNKCLNLPIGRKGKDRQNRKEREIKEGEQTGEELIEKEKLVKNEFSEHTVGKELIEKQNLIKNEVSEKGNAEILKDCIITKKMLEEEQMIEEKLIKNEKELEKKMQMEEKQIKEEQCYKRLHLLLSRSSIYAKFMAEKLQKQEDAQRKKLEEIKAYQKSKLNKGCEGKHKVTNQPPAKKHKTNVNIVDVFKKENMANIKLDDKLNDRKENMSEGGPELLYGGTMRSYQLDGFEWLKTLFENGVNGILADEMGLGKTIQCIAFVAYLIEMGITGPFFVCGPLSTVSNWCSEFKRFTPDIPVLLYHGDKDERNMLRNKINKKYQVRNFWCCPVVITSYQIALIDCGKLASNNWKLLVVDEAHRIKNFRCKLITSLKSYNTVHRLLLTGTPLQNDLSELWSLLNFILPEIFDDLQVFESWFDLTRLRKNGISKEIVSQEKEKQIVSIIHQILTPFLLRRTKADVELGLPPKKEIIVHAPLTSLQQKYYTAVLNGTIRKVLGIPEVDFDKEIASGSLGKRKRTVEYSNFFVDNDSEDEVENNENQMPCNSNQSSNTAYKLPYGSSTSSNNSELHIQFCNVEMSLREICGHPYIISYPLDFEEQYRIDEDLVQSSGKLLVLDAMLPELKKRGHKVIIFSQFLMMLRILEDYCWLRNYNCQKLYGTMNLLEREEALKNFKCDTSFIFLISTNAGGLGINLVEADTVIIYDSSFNPQCDLQAQDRCHRIGQTKPVIVYRLIVPNTYEAEMYKRATIKRKLEKVIMQKGRFTSKNTLTKSQKSITKEELIALLESSDASTFINTDDKSVISPGELEKILDRSDMVWQPTAK